MVRQVSYREFRETGARATEPILSQPGLLSLPHDALLLIAQELSAWDRVRLACCCKALYNSSSGFWATLELVPETVKEAKSIGEAERLLPWLQPRCGAIRKLRILQSCEAVPDSERYTGSAEMRFDPDLCSCLTPVLGQLAGGPLESLDWQGSGFLGSLALAALPRLRSCVMRAYSSYCTSRLHGCFSRLAELRRLSIVGFEWINICWEPGCLPSGLEELTLKRVGFVIDPVTLDASSVVNQRGGLIPTVVAAASHATRLRSLTLDAIQSNYAYWREDEPKPLQLDALSRLAHLTQLSLSATARGFIGLPAAGPTPDLAPLTALTALQQLKIGFNDHPRTPMGVQLQALTALSQLTSIAIHNPKLAELPRSIDALWHLPNLKAVALVQCPVTQHLAEALDGSCIEKLTLVPASVMAMGPCRLPSLHALHISLCSVSFYLLADQIPACMRSILANVQPTPPLLVWEYDYRETMTEVQRILAGHLGPPRCEFQKPYKNSEEEFGSDDEDCSWDEEESETESFGVNGSGGE